MNYPILLNNLEKFRKKTILSNIDYSEINCEIIKNDSNKINKNKKDEKKYQWAVMLFFKDFKSKDKDYLIFIDNPEDFKIRKEICLRGTVSRKPTALVGG